MAEIHKKCNCENGIISALPPLDTGNVKGLGRTFFEKMSAMRDELAEIYGPSGEKQTWGTVLKHSIQAAIMMRKKLGLTSDHFLAICEHNYPENVVPLSAALFLGAKVTIVDPTSLPDTITILKQIRPKLMIVGHDLQKFAEDAIRDAETDTKIILYGTTLKHFQYCWLFMPSREEKTFEPVEAKDVKETAFVVFKKSPEGKLKGVCLSHYALLAPKLDKGYIFDRKPSLSFSSLYHMRAITVLIQSILYGGTRVLCPVLDLELIWNMITEFEVCVLFLTASEVVAVCKNIPENFHTSNLTVIIDGFVATEQLVEVRKFFPSAVNNYALSELADNGLEWTPEEIQLALDKPKSVGRPMPGLQYKVVNPETEEVLESNQKGELRIKSDFVMNGYYNDQSADLWDSNNFLKTGDIAYYDADYCFYIDDTK